MATNGLIWSSEPVEYFLKLAILILDFQGPKSAVFQMFETVESNISFTFRFLKTYHENVLNWFKSK